MGIERFYSANYEEARKKFLATAAAAGAEIASIPHPLKGPRSEALATDVGRIGAHDAKKVLVTSSATHGVEGFCGSACQIGLFETNLAQSLPPDTALLQIHAHNPHGFAYERRVTEDNVDLNRNSIDFSRPLPTSPAYDEIHAALVPTDWDGPARAAADEAIAAYVRERGFPAFQAAVTGGQYAHPDGLFYGGSKPTWSHQTIRSIALEMLRGKKHVALIDFHSGLGPRGQAELLSFRQNSDYQRAREWYGDVKSPGAVDSQSAAVVGTIDRLYRDAVGVENFTFLVIEYGTVPIEDMLLALRADNWLYLHGDVSAPLGRRIKSDIRAAFYGEDVAWKTDIWTRGQELARRALAGLATL
jgi:hypothetical protein